MNWTQTEVETGVCKLHIEGALDVLSVRQIHPVMDAVVASKPTRVSIDFNDLTMIDSSGVGAIISLFKRIKAGGGEFTVVGAHDQPLAVLKVLKLDRVLGL